MRLLLVITCVASLAANEARAQVAPLAGMARPGIGATNIGVHAAMRGQVSGVGRGYGTYLGQNNNAALGRQTTAAPLAASTLGQPPVNLNQRMAVHGGTMFDGGTMFHGGRSMFQGNGAQRYNPAAFQESGAQNRNAAARLQYGGPFGRYSGLPADGMGNINIQVGQVAQAPAAMQTAQHVQTPAAVQTAQQAQTPAAPQAAQQAQTPAGVYGGSMYGGYPMNNGVPVRTY